MAFSTYEDEHFFPGLVATDPAANQLACRVRTMTSVRKSSFR